MSREEIAAFLASLKKLRDSLDDFNCQTGRHRRRWDASWCALQGNRDCLSCRCGGRLGERVRNILFAIRNFARAAVAVVKFKLRRRLGL
jgi:hypothetical protein